MLYCPEMGGSLPGRAVPIWLGVLMDIVFGLRRNL